MTEVLRTAVVGAVTLRPPAAAFDRATSDVLQAEIAAAAAAARADGHAQGREAATREIDRAVAGIVAAVDRAAAEVAGQRAQAVAADLAVVAHVVDAVLAACPPDATDAVATRIREAVARLDDDVLDVRVSPHDAQLLGSQPFDPRVRLLADPSVAPGEAHVAGTWGRAELTRAALTRAALEAIAPGAAPAATLGVAPGVVPGAAPPGGGP